MWNSTRTLIWCLNNEDPLRASTLLRVRGVASGGGVQVMMDLCSGELCVQTGKTELPRVRATNVDPYTKVVRN